MIETENELVPKKWLAKKLNIQTVLIVLSIYGTAIFEWTAIKTAVDSSVSMNQELKFWRDFQKVNPSINVPDFPTKSPDEKLPSIPFFGEAIINPTEQPKPES